MADATIYSPRGAPLVITSDDRLWLARAVDAEGAPETLVAQTLVNRWANLHDAQPYAYPTLASLVRAYSQTVNPRWMPGGDLLSRHMAQLEPREAAAELERAQRRVEHAQRNVFSPEAIEAVRRAVDGPIAIPYGAVHFGPQKAGDWAYLTLVPGVPGVSNAIYRSHEGGGLYRLSPIPFAPSLWGPAMALETASPVAGLAIAAFGLATVWRLARAYRGR